MKKKVNNLRTFSWCNLKVGISIVVLPHAGAYLNLLLLLIQVVIERIYTAR